MINPTDSRIPVWLVWSILTNGHNVLNAICLTNERAIQYRKLLLSNDTGERTRYGRVSVRIEQTEANHLYAEMFRMS